MLPSNAPAIPLENFVLLKDYRGQVEIVSDGDGKPAVVISSGQTGAGRRVDWVTADSAPPIEQQVVERFVAALSAQYGPRIAASVASELELGAQPGLQAEAIGQAVRMAATQRVVYSGANFFVELHCSATGHGPGFRNACLLAGIDPERLGQDQRKSLDVMFQPALLAATEGNREPLSPSDGERVMVQVLTTFFAPASHVQGDDAT